MADKLAVIQSDASIAELKLINNQLTETIKLFDDLIKKTDGVNSMFTKGTPKEYMDGMSKLSDLMERLAKAEKSLIDISAKYEVINTKLNKSTDEKKKALSDYDRELEKTIKLEGEEYKAVARQKVINAELTKEKRQQAQAEVQAQQRLAASISLYNKVELKIKALTVRYNELATKKALGLKLNDSEEKSLNNLSAKIQKYDQVLKAVDTTVGKNQRNVGNYKSGFNELGNSVNQLSREMPAFANSVQTGFMAISNNLPIFFDAIGNIKKQNAALRADGKPTVSTFKQIAGSIFSLGTILSIGVTLLTIYGEDMYEFAKAVLAGSQASQNAKKNIEDLNKAKSEGLKSAASEISQLKILYRVSTDVSLSTEQRMRAVRKLQDLYPSYFGNMTAESIMLGRATAQYKELAGAIISSAQARAIENILTERMEKSLLDQEAQQNKLNEAIKEADAIRKSGRSETQTVSDGQGGLIRKEIDNQVLLGRAIYKVGVLRNGMKKLVYDDEKKNEALINKKIGLENQSAKYDSDKYGKDAPKDKKAKPGLFQMQKDSLSDLEAERDIELAINERKYIEGIANEEEYVERQFQINKDFYEKKLAFIKGKTVQERKMIADTQLDLVKAEKDRDSKIYDIRKKQLDDSKNLMEAEIANKMKAVQNDPYSMEVDRITQQAKVYDELITRNDLYYETLIKNAGKNSDLILQIEKERDEKSIELQTKRQDLLANTPDAFKKDLEYYRQIEDAYIVASDLEERRVILANSRLDISQRNYLISILEKDQQIAMLDTQRKRLEGEKAMIIVKSTILKLTNQEQSRLAEIDKSLSDIALSTKEIEQIKIDLEWGKIKEGLAPTIDFIKSSFNDLGLENLSNNFDKVFDSIGRRWKETGDLSMTVAEAMILSASTVADALSSISEAQKERTIANLDEQLKVSQENAETELDFISQRLEMLNAIQDKTAEQIAERNALEDEARVIREQQQQREKLIAIQKAKAEQKAQAQQALISAGLAAVNSYASLAAIPVVGPGLGAAAAIAALAFGALQAGMIMAKNPVPQYYVGTDNARGGMAWTQERGAEIITDKNDNIKSYGNNRGAQLTMLEAGDKVYTSSETKSIMTNFPKPNWGKIANDAVYMPTINISKDNIDYDLLAGKIGGKFENVVKKYDKVNIYEENGVIYKQVGSKIPVAISAVSGSRKENRGKDYRNFRD